MSCERDASLSRDETRAHDVSFDYDYLVVGHVTCDLIEDAPDGPPKRLGRPLEHPTEPREQPGGGAFYSGLQAARLGLRTLIVTQGSPDELERLLAPYRGEFEVLVLPARHTTTLATRGSGRERVQRLCAWAGEIEVSALASAGIASLPSARIAHLAPVAREIPPTLADALTLAHTSAEPHTNAHTESHAEAMRASAPFVGVTPQGLVRAWGRDGGISPTPLSRDSLPRRIDAAVVNEQEVESCAALLQQDPPALLAITAGSDAIRLRLAEGETVSAPPMVLRQAQDDLGAGDVFAAALFAKLQSGSPPLQAARFASAAAALKVSGRGPDAIADRASVERALRGIR